MYRINLVEQNILVVCDQPGEAAEFVLLLEEHKTEPTEVVISSEDPKEKKISLEGDDERMQAARTLLARRNKAKFSSREKLRFIVASLIDAGGEPIHLREFASKLDMAATSMSGKVQTPLRHKAAAMGGKFEDYITRKRDVSLSGGPMTYAATPKTIELLHALQDEAASA